MLFESICLYFCGLQQYLYICVKHQSNQSNFSVNIFLFKILSVKTGVRVSMGAPALQWTLVVSSVDAWQDILAYFVKVSFTFFCTFCSVYDYV